jgi:F-type H+-transporting ATPase subunit b
LELVLAALAAGRPLAQPLQAAESGIVFNGFWILVAALNFVVFLGVLQVFAFKPVSRMLEDRRKRIERGLIDADAARVEREQAASERVAALAAARQEADEVLVRAQRVADENRERQLAETRAEIERLREKATGDIEAERLRALADVRSQVAELALLAAGRVVGETMNQPRQRRLVDDFLTQLADADGGAGPAPSN